MAGLLTGLKINSIKVLGSPNKSFLHRESGNKPSRQVLSLLDPSRNIVVNPGGINKRIREFYSHICLQNGMFVKIS